MDNSRTRWMKVNPKEKMAKSGIPMGYDTKEECMLVDNDSFHHLIIGSMGSGKTQVITLPMLKMMIRANESFVVTDRLGEIYNQLGGILEAEGYETILLNFKDYQYGNHWNPFSNILSCYQQGDKDRTEELLHSLVNQIFLNSSEIKDPFWDNSVANYFMGLVYLLLEEEEPITFQSIYDLSQQGNEKLEDISYFKRYYQDKKTRNSYHYLSSIFHAPVETRSSILSVFYQKMSSFLMNSGLVEMMNVTDFDMKNIGNRKTGVFIILPENMRKKEFVSFFIKQIYENNSENEKPFHFLLDDFHQLDPIVEFPNLLENAIRRNIYFTVMIPSFQTFYEKYGDKEGKKIKEFFMTILYLLSHDINTIKEIASLCGTVNRKGRELPFITERELRTLNPWEGVVIKSRDLPRKVQLSPSYRIEWDFNVKSVEIKPHPIVSLPKFEFQNLILSEQICQ